MLFNLISYILPAGYSEATFYQFCANFCPRLRNPFDKVLFRWILHVSCSRNPVDVFHLPLVVFFSHQFWKRDWQVCPTVEIARFDQQEQTAAWRSCPREILLPSAFHERQTDLEWKWLAFHPGIERGIQEALCPNLGSTIWSFHHHIFQNVKLVQLSLR